jgi:hypothetical protein
MPNLSYTDVLLVQNMYESSATQKHPLGTRGMTADGRVFRYCLAGASDLVAGNLIQSPAPIANHLALTPSAASAGALQVVATLGATAAAANLYAEGYVQVDTTPGNGYTYTIKDHQAVASAGVITANLVIDDPIQVALTTSSRVGFMQNPYSGVIQAPTTLTAQLAGVAVYIIKATQYGWLQTWGPCSVLINGTPAVTAPVINSATTAGAVDVWTAAAQPTAQLVGKMMQVGVSGKNNFVDLQIRP